jgi:hypothetical protein
MLMIHSSFKSRKVKIADLTNVEGMSARRNEVRENEAWETRV